MTLQTSFLKSIFVQKNAYYSICDIIMSIEHFEIKKQRFAPLLMVKHRKLSTVPLNFDCSHVWQ